MRPLAEVVQGMTVQILLHLVLLLLAVVVEDLEAATVEQAVPAAVALQVLVMVEQVLLDRATLVVVVLKPEPTRLEVGVLVQ